MERQEIIEKRYNELLDKAVNKGNIFPEIIDFIEVLSNNGDLDAEKLKRYNCNYMLYLMTSGWLEYNYDFRNNEDASILLCQIEKMKEPNSYYRMVQAIFQGEELKTVLELLNNDITDIMKRSNEKLDEYVLVDSYIEVIKNSYNGFWEYADKILSPNCLDDGTHELCKLMNAVYSRRNDEEAIDILNNFIVKYPKLTLPRELLSIFYINTKKWHNAVAQFENIEKPNFYGCFLDSFYFNFAWACDKARLNHQAEQNYRKCLEFYPNCEWALNNLGYVLLRQKRYLDAKDVFKQCIDEKRDFPNSVNGYAKTLIALGRNKDAKEFAKEYSNKLNSVIKKKINSLDSTNKKISKAVDIEVDDEDVYAKPVHSNKPAYQFSSEKVLEDELTNRIENGYSVFGLDLKIYRRKGVYGRQFGTPVGILDLLCEDKNGNLYIIELKKDSGYDDPYKQTVRYVEWFEKQEEFNKNKIFGIICLNEPTEKTINDVRNDKRIHLYEYSISYSEIK